MILITDGLSLPLDELPSSSSASSTFLTSFSSSPSNFITSTTASLPSDVILNVKENFTTLSSLPNTDNINLEIKNLSYINPALLSIILNSSENLNLDVKSQQHLHDKILISFSKLNSTNLFYFGAETSFEQEEEADFLSNMIEDYRHILLMYLVHALPYTQSAFNWLFYAFLNRNLRQSARCSANTRSAVTATPLDLGNRHSSCQYYNGENNGNLYNSRTEVSKYFAKRRGGSMDKILPFWKNIQYVGSFLRSAATDSSNTVLKRTPFLFKPRVRSRSDFAV